MKGAFRITRTCSRTGMIASAASAFSGNTTRDLMSYLSLFRVSVLAVAHLAASVLVAQNAVPADPPSHSPSASALRNFGNLPLRFEANRGQTAAEALFLSRGHGFTLYLTRTEAVLALRELDPSAGRVKENVPRRHRSSRPHPRRTIQHSLRLSLLNASAAPVVTGEEPLPGVINYFIGSDPAQWQAGVESFGRVKYAAVYPGIDLVYYGNQGRLEYDFSIAPGADPAQIGFTFEGAHSVQSGEGGELIVRLANGEIRWQAPVAYQTIDGARREVSCAYDLRGQSEIRFSLGAHDPAATLTIDPVLSYSTYLGGNDQDYTEDIAVDRAGNVFVTGQTDSFNFPTNRAFRGTNSGNADVFVSKINTNGSTLVYSTYLGGTNADFGLGIAVDAGGNACVVGYTDSRNFPLRNATQIQLNGGNNPTNSDAFIVKLGTNGTNLIFSTYLGGTLAERANDVAVDTGTNNVYVTGETASSNFPQVVLGNPNSIFQRDPGGFTDAFVAKYNATAASVTYASWLGGGDDDLGQGIAVDASGAVYVCGDVLSCDFCGPSFPSTPGVFQPGYGGLLTDGFVAKINAAGTGLTFASYLGGAGEDMAARIALDTNGNIYVVGATGSTNFPVTTNGFQTVNGYPFGSRNDAYLVKIRNDGAAILHGTYFGGDLLDQANSVAVDPAGNVYLTGTTISDDFPTGGARVQAGYGGNSDAFAAMFNLNLNGADSLIYSTYLGGPGGEEGNGIAVDTNGNVYVTGRTLGTNTFTGGPGVVQPNFGGGDSDSFITKLAPRPSLRWSRSGTNHLAQWIAFPPGWSLVAVTNVNLSNWPAAAGAITVSNGMNRVVVTNTGPRRFLRLRKP